MDMLKYQLWSDFITLPFEPRDHFGDVKNA